MLEIITKHSILREYIFQLIFQSVGKKLSVTSYFNNTVTYFSKIYIIVELPCELGFHFTKMFQFPSECNEGLDFYLLHVFCLSSFLVYFFSKIRLFPTLLILPKRNNDVIKRRSFSQFLRECEKARCFYVNEFRDGA